MIKIVFHKCGNFFLGFDVENHADFEDGVDRVCTAVSVLVSHTVKSIAERYGNLGFYDKRKGYLSFRVKRFDDDRSNEFISALLNSVKDLELRFSSNIRVEVCEHSNEFVKALLDSLKNTKGSFPSNMHVEVMKDGT